MKKKIKHWLYGDYKHKYINGSKGVISIFLMTLLLPFTALTGILVEGGRYSAGTSLVDSSMNSAAMSVMADYDTYLYDRFGLVATDQENKIQGDFDTYFRANINSQSSWDIASTKAEGNKELTLDNIDVLKAQIMEMGKFSVPISLAADVTNIQGLIDLFTKSGLDGKLNGLVDKFTRYGELAEKMSETVQKVQDLISKIKDMDKSRDSYQKKHGDWKNGVDDLYAQIKLVEKLADERDKAQASWEASKNYDTYESEIASLESDISSAESDITSLDMDDPYYDSDRSSLESDISDYESRISDYESRVAESMRIEQEKYEVYSEAYDKWSAEYDKLDPLRSRVQAKSGSYKDSVEDIQKSFDEYIEGIEAVFKSAGGIYEKFVGTYKEVMQKKNKETQADRDANFISEEEYNASLISNDTIDDRVKIGKARAKEEIDVCDKIIEGASEEMYAEFRNKLKEIFGKMSSFSAYSDSQVEYAHDNPDDYFIEVVKYCSVETAEEIIQEIYKSVGEDKVFAVFDGFIDFFDALCATKGIVDTRLDKILNMPTAGGQLMGATMLRAIGSLIQAINSFKEGGGNGFVGFIRGIIDPIGKVIKFFKTLVSLLKAVIDGFVAIVAIVSSMISNLAQTLFTPSQWYKKGVEMQYYAKSLANRTTYRDDKRVNVLTGFKFEDVHWPRVAGGGSGSTGIEDAVDGKEFLALADLAENGSAVGSDPMIAGCEFEYIIGGSNSELVNQVTVFAQLYILRMIANISTILSSKEITMYAEAAGLATAVLGGVGTILVYTLYFLIEPLADCILLVNDEQIPIVKRTPWYTIEGIPKLWNKLTSLKNLQIKEDAASAQKKLPELDSKKKSIIGISKTDAIDNMLQTSYSQHLFILSLLFSNQKDALARFKNLVTMEARHNKGERKSWEANKAYTVLDMNVKADFRLTMPLMNKYKFNSINRNMMRGY